MSPFIPIRPVRNLSQQCNRHSSSTLFILTLAISGLVSLSVTPSFAIPTRANSSTPDYVPPARETPLRTESAGVRLGEEKGPASVTQNTIATERLVIYRPAIGSILDQLYGLLPTVPKHLFQSIRRLRPGD